MVSFSVSSMFFHEYSCSDIFSFISRTGLDGVEFWPETPDFWLRDQPVDEIIACRNAHPDLKNLTLHSPILDLNPCSINPVVAQVSIDFALRSVGMAGLLGADTLTVHPGKRTAKRRPSPADLKRFEHYIGLLREAAGKNRVTICMENMEPAVNSLLCTPAGVRALLDNEPWLFFTLDVSHALLKDEKEPARYIELCHDRLKNVHMSRVVKGKPHYPLAHDPRMAGLMERLAGHGFNGSLTLEIEDLTFDRVLTSEEKINVLKDDCAFMRECVQ
jgi:sugar phosphate isomerase/epimerase